MPARDQDAYLVRLCSENTQPPVPRARGLYLVRLWAANPVPAACAPRSPSARAGVSVDTLLRAFYQPVFDMARLVQTSAVESSLATEADIAGGKDQWRLCCELPTLIEKLWADLHEQRTRVPVNLRRTETANPALVDGCMYVYNNMDQIAAAITDKLAGQFMHRLVLMYVRLNLPSLNVLSKDAQRSRIIMDLWQQKQHRESLAQYFRAQIEEQLTSASRESGCTRAA